MYDAAPQVLTPASALHLSASELASKGQVLAVIPQRALSFEDARLKGPDIPSLTLILRQGSMTMVFVHEKTAAVMVAIWKHQLTIP
eukprot:CAMPEP_0172687214 /NCGR_PEP_ID=MMETSP1074-20121228/21512_1 /TAXON_ID=2916 /ORGANISM="Ceratium fusus, Strain PA161109" /LENGTH=85 /DNA_ID=CAMNT_0013506639 /DNA_START=736 /DNA_END=993 /DNA_ORIENTATION=-